MEHLPRNVEHLSRLYGIETSYIAMRGEKRPASLESLLAILRVLGSDVTDVDHVDRAITRREEELWERAVEPVVVAWDGDLPPIRIKTRSSGTRITGAWVLEDGTSEEFRVPLDRLRKVDERQIGKVRYIEREWQIKRTLPDGYHYLQLRIDATTHKTLVISAPSKAHFPFKRKQWGVFAPMYSLRSAQHPNAGTVSEFESLMTWMLGHGGRIAATLPLLSSFLDSPFEPSPYSPISRLFWNEFYIDTGKPSPPRKSDLVDYQREMQFRRNVLRKQAAAFFKNHNNEDRQHFREFIQRNREVTSYARFRAVTENQAAGWSSWPSRLRDGRITRADYDPAVEQYHLYAQWRIQSQLRNMADKASRNGQLLYLDLPLGLHPESYDIWRYRDLFVREAAGGAPPDPVFTKGQNWCFPPMRPETSRLTHYEYTIAYLRNHLQKARLLRIDHVMGLHRLYWIPQGFTGDKGVYVRYPAHEMYAILSLESHRHKAGIVGENLGTVPPEVNSSMRRHNIHQMIVIQYELEAPDSKKALRSIPRNAVASLNTHDMFPFRAFLAGSDIEDRLKLQFLDPAGAKKERARRANMKRMLIELLLENKLLPKVARPSPAAIFRATMEFLASSDSNVVLINIDDLLGESLPQNVPATQEERPNWRRLTRLNLEQMQKSSAVSQILHAVEEERR